MHKPSSHSTRLRLIVLTIILAFLPFTAFAQTEVSGEVSGEWTAEDSPYIVVDSTWIPEDEELLIGPGVDVLFSEGLGLDVLGSIITEGTEDDSVRFLPLEEDLTWRGLNLIGWWPWADDHLSFTVVRGVDNAFLLGYYVYIYINNCNIQSVNKPIGELPGDGHQIYAEITNSIIIGGNRISLNQSGLFAENTMFRTGSCICNSDGTILLDNCTVLGNCYSSSAYYRNSRFIKLNDSTNVYLEVNGVITGCYVEGNVSGRANTVKDNVIHGDLSVEDCSASINNNTIGENFFINSCDSVSIDSCIVQGYISIGQSDYIKVTNVTVLNTLQENHRAIGIFGTDDWYENNYHIERCSLWGHILTRCFVGSTDIINNTIAVMNRDRSDSVIKFQGDGPVEIRNNIIETDNDEFALFNFLNEGCIGSLVFKYNCIWGTDYLVWDNRIDYELDHSNILENPLLVSLDSLDLHLTEDSPCIDTGDPRSYLDPDNTRADMGRFYFHHENSVSNYTIPILNGFELLSVYPNPFNSKLNIDFFTPISQPITIVLYDINGRELTKEDKQWNNIGRHSFIIDGKSLPSGSYFVSLKSDKFVRYQKVELVR